MATYKETTGRSIEQDFRAFHEKHPAVYEYFKQFAREQIQAQRHKGIPKEKCRTSSKLIINRIRWEMSINNLQPTPPTNQPNQPTPRQSDQSEWNALAGNYQDFKINDAFTALYARLFQHHYPEWAHIFNIRVRRAANPQKQAA